MRTQFSGHGAVVAACLAALTPLAIAILPGRAAADEFKRSVKLVMAKNDRAARSHRRIARLDDETERLVRKYRDIEQRTEGLLVYNAQVERLVNGQQAKLESLQQQITNAARVGREMTPLMLRMLDTLEAFVKLDVPFLVAERRKRLANLRSMMNLSDVPDSEKARRILEAYQIENEYGRTIEAYKATLSVGSGPERTLDLLRVGRVALIYRTLDGAESGYWDRDEKRWKKLPDRFRASVRKGFRIARKQAAPDLIRLPVPAPKEASR